MSVTVKCNNDLKNIAEMLDTVTHEQDLSVKVQASELGTDNSRLQIAFSRADSSTFSIWGEDNVAYAIVQFTASGTKYQVNVGGTWKQVMPKTYSLSMAPVLNGAVTLTKAGNIVVVNGRYAGALKNNAAVGAQTITATIPDEFCPNTTYSIGFSVGANSHWIECNYDGTVKMTFNVPQSAGAYAYGINGSWIVKGA